MNVLLETLLYTQSLSDEYAGSAVSMISSSSGGGGGGSSSSSSGGGGIKHFFIYMVLEVWYLLYSTVVATTRNFICMDVAVI